MRVTEKLPPATTPNPAVSDEAPFEGFSRQLLDALNELRAGNFTVPLPSARAGRAGRIADAFNDIALLNQQRANEIARVCRMVGKEGKLKERLAMPRGLGARSDEIASLNTLIDDLVWPTSAVTRAVGAVAKGD